MTNQEILEEINIRLENIKRALGIPSESKHSNELDDLPDIPSVPKVSKYSKLYAENEEIIEKASNQYSIVSTLTTARESNMISINVTDDVELLFRSTISIHECEERINKNNSSDAIGKAPTRKTAYKRARYSATTDNLTKVDRELSNKYYKQVKAKTKKIKFRYAVIFIALAALLTYGLFKLAQTIIVGMASYPDDFYLNTNPMHAIIATSLQIGGGMMVFATFFFFSNWSSDPQTAAFWVLSILGTVISVIGGFVFFCMGYFEVFLTFLGCNGIIAVIVIICDLTDITLESITEKPISKARNKIWAKLNCYEPIDRYNKRQTEMENYDQSCLDRDYRAEVEEHNQHRKRLGEYNDRLRNLIEAHQALIAKSTILPPSFKDARSIVYIYRELKDGLSDTLKEAKQRCDAKKDTEDFRAKVLNSIERGFNALDNHLSAQMSAAMAQLEHSQSLAFAELQAQQSRFAKEQSAQLNSAMQRQSDAIGLIASKNESYIESAKKNDEKMQESLRKIQEEVKKKNDCPF